MKSIKKFFNNLTISSFKSTIIVNERSATIVEKHKLGGQASLSCQLSDNGNPVETYNNTGDFSKQDVADVKAKAKTFCRTGQKPGWK